MEKGLKILIETLKAKQLLRTLKIDFETIELNKEMIENVSIDFISSVWDDFAKDNTSEEIIFMNLLKDKIKHPSEMLKKYDGDLLEFHLFCFQTLLIAMIYMKYSIEQTHAITKINSKTEEHENLAQNIVNKLNEIIGDSGVDPNLMEINELFENDGIAKTDNVIRLAKKASS